MQDLGMLGGHNSWGCDINNDNQVVGESDTDREESGGHNLTRAFLWQHRAMTDLGALAEDGFSAASAISADGIVVGWGSVRASSIGGTRGFLLIPIDPEGCEVEEEEDNGSTDGDDLGGDGAGAPGAAIVGTPANLAAGSDSDEGTSDAEGAAGLAGLCGFGTAAVIPLMLAGLCLTRAGAGNRLRRAG